MLVSARIVLVAVFCLNSVVFLHGDESETAIRIAQASVADREGNPLKDAEIYRLSWLDESANPPVKSNDKGIFEFPVDTSLRPHSNYVIIYRAGYSLGALNLEALPAQARLHPRRPIAFRVLDPEGEPIEGAQVYPREMSFGDEFLHAYVPAELGRKKGAITREDGWAILRCVAPTSVVSLVVESEDYGSQIFLSNLSKDTKFRVLQLRETATLILEVRNGEQPAFGHRVVGTIDDRGWRPWDDQNKVARKLPLRSSGILCNQETDGDGRIRFEHAPTEIELKFLIVPEDRQRSEERIVKHSDAAEGVFRIQVKPEYADKLRNYTARIVDLGTGKPVAGMQLRFASNEMRSARCLVTSGKQGEISPKLAPGTWSVHVEKAPPGYCKTLLSSSRIQVPEEPLVLQNFEAVRAKEVKGTIRGIDLKLHRARWINAKWRDINDQSKAGNVYGTIFPDSSFEISIPVGSRVIEYSMVSHSDHDGKLSEVSQVPLILSGILELDPLP